MRPDIIRSAQPVCHFLPPRSRPRAGASREEGGAMKSSSSTGSMARLNAGAAAWASMDKVVRARMRNAHPHATRRCVLRAALPAACGGVKPWRGASGKLRAAWARCCTPCVAASRRQPCFGAATRVACCRRGGRARCARARAGLRRCSLSRRRNPESVQQPCLTHNAPASSIGVAFRVCATALCLRCRFPERGAVHAHIRRPRAPGTRAAVAAVVLEPRALCTNPADAVVNTRAARGAADERQRGVRGGRERATGQTVRAPVAPELRTGAPGANRLVHVCVRCHV
jgi:hypothetical protein